MSLKFSAIALLCLALVISEAAFAVQAPTPGDSAAVAAEPSRAEGAVIPARTTVVLELLQPISTRTAKPGDRFELRVLEALLIAGHVVIPAGSPALGEVIHAQKGGVFGKPGELLLTVRHVAVGGQKIPMRLFQPARGKDHTGVAMAATVTAAVTVPVAGLFAAFITGGQIELPAGTPVNAMVARDTLLAIPPPAPNLPDEQGSPQ